MALSLFGLFTAFESIFKNLIWWFCYHLRPYDRQGLTEDVCETQEDKYQKECS